jgi:hypothetical protein
LIRLQCDCGNDDQREFDTYVSPCHLCKVLTIVCRQCGETREEFVAGGEDAILLAG